MPPADAGSDAGSGVSTCEPAPSSTADLYVAPNGQASWSGTLSAPNADASDGPTTLAAIESKIQPLQAGRTTPIVVFLEDGTYDLHSELGGAWTLALSGTKDAPIVYEAAPGATPIISGGTVITGWASTTVNGVAAWQAPADSLQPFAQLWVNGERRFRPTTSPGAYLYNQNTAVTQSSFTYAGTDLDPSWYDLAHVEIAAFESWTMPRLYIQSIDPTTSTVTFTSTLPTGVGHGFMPHHRYFADNVKEALNQPGQFYLDQAASPKRLYYIPRTGEDMTTAQVVAPQLPKLVQADGISYVTLRGLTMSYANFTIPSPQGWLDVQTESNNVANAAAAVTFHATSNVTVDGCTIAHVAGFGIEFEGNAAGAALPDADTDCATTFETAIVNSVVADTGGGGIRIGSGQTMADTDATVAQCALVADNVVTGVGRYFASGNGIFVGNAHHVRVRHNDVSDTYTYAIDVGATYGNSPDNYSDAGNAHDNTIEFNHVWQVGQGVTSDIGGIYTAVGPQTGNVVQNNVVHDVTHDPGNAAAGEPEGYGGWGLYNDASSSNVLWQNNLAYRCSQSPMTFNYGASGLIQNNILAYGSEGVMTAGRLEAHLQYTFQHNILYWDQPQLWQYGNWSCSLSSPTDCRAFADNLYVDVGGTPTFITQNEVEKVGMPPMGPTLSFAQWQADGEDAPPSTTSFPLSFGTPAAPSFALPATLPIAFTPFDPTQAGRDSCATTAPPPVPAGFPVQAWPVPF